MRDTTNTKTNKAKEVQKAQNARDSRVADSQAVSNSFGRNPGQSAANIASQERKRSMGITPQGAITRGAFKEDKTTATTTDVFVQKFKVSDGKKSYTLSRDELEGVKDLYKQTWNDYYDQDDEDQMNKRNGVMPRSFANGYKKEDKALYDLGLPSWKYLDKYLDAYRTARDEQKKIEADYNAKQTRLNEFYKAVGEKWLSDEQENGNYNAGSLFKDYDEAGNDLGTMTSWSDRRQKQFFDMLDLPEWSDVKAMYDLKRKKSATKDPSEYESVQDYYEAKFDADAKRRAEYAKVDAADAKALTTGKKGTDKQLAEAVGEDIVDSERASLYSVSFNFDDFNQAYNDNLRSYYAKHKFVDEESGITFTGQEAIDLAGNIKAVQAASSNKDNFDKYVADHSDDYIGMLDQLAGGYASDEFLTSAKNKAISDINKNKSLTAKERKAQKNAINEKYDSIISSRQAQVSPTTGKAMPSIEDWVAQTTGASLSKNLFNPGKGGVVSSDSLTDIFKKMEDEGYSQDDIKRVHREMLSNAKFASQREKIESEYYQNYDGGINGYASRLANGFEDKGATSAFTTEQVLDRVSQLANSGALNSNTTFENELYRLRAVDHVSSAVLRDAVNQYLSAADRDGDSDGYARGDIAPYVNGNNIDALKAWGYTERSMTSSDGQRLRERLNAFVDQFEKDEHAALIEMSRAKFEGRFDAFDIDQAFSRVGWQDAIPIEQRAMDYFIAYGHADDVMSGDNKDEAIRYYQMSDDERKAESAAVWDAMTPEEQQSYVDEFDLMKDFNPVLNKSYAQQVTQQFVGAWAKVAVGLIKGAANLSDMTNKWFANSASAEFIDDIGSERYEKYVDNRQVSIDGIRKLHAAISQYGKAQGQDGISNLISLGSDVMSEVMRMATMNFIGGGFGNVIAKVGGIAGGITTLADGTTAISRGLGMMVKVASQMPFISDAIGNYWEEAMQEEGVTTGAATVYALVCGTLEGAVEALNMDAIAGGVLGGNRLAEHLLKNGKLAMSAGFRAKCKLIGLCASALGEGGEEAISNVVSKILGNYTIRRNQFDTQPKTFGEMVKRGFANWSWSEFWNDVGMGMLTGLVANGISGENQFSPEYIICEDMMKKGINPTGLEILHGMGVVNSMSKSELDDFRAHSTQADLLSDDQMREYNKTLLDCLDKAQQAQEQFDATVKNRQELINKAEKQVKRFATSRRNALNNNDAKKATQYGRSLAEWQIKVDQAKADLNNNLPKWQANLANQVAPFRSQYLVAEDAIKRHWVAFDSAMGIYKMGLSARKKASSVNLELSDNYDKAMKVFEDMGRRVTAQDLKNAVDSTVAKADADENVAPVVADADAAIQDGEELAQAIREDGAEGAATLEQAKTEQNAQDTAVVEQAIENEQQASEQPTEQPAETEVPATEPVAEQAPAIEEEPNAEPAPEPAPQPDNDPNRLQFIASEEELRKQNIDEGRIELDANAQESVRKYAKSVFKVDVTFMPMSAGMNGYNLNGKIYLNTFQLNRKGASVAEVGKMVFLHELTHSLEGTSSYGVLQNLVKRAIVEKYGKQMGFDESTYEEKFIVPYYLDPYNAQLRKNGQPPINLSGARREAIADFIAHTALVTDESGAETVKAFADFVARENGGLAGHIFNAITNFIKRFGKRQDAFAKILYDSQKVWAKALKEANVDMGESMKFSFGFHAGDLGKAEWYRNQSGNRDTGHFGTGTYFVGDEALINQWEYGKRPHYKVEFDNYNLFKVKNAEDGYALHDFLRGMDSFPTGMYQFKTVNEYEDAVNELGKSIESLDDLTSVDDDFNIIPNDPVEFANAVRQVLDQALAINDGTTEWWAGRNIETVTDENGDYNWDAIAQSLANDEDWYWKLKDLREELDSYDSKREAFRSQSFNNGFSKVAEILGVTEQDIADAVADVQSQLQGVDRQAKVDSAATRFMKHFGYEGINVNGIKELDNTTYGSVIYDLHDEDRLENKPLTKLSDNTYETADGGVVTQFSLAYAPRTEADVAKEVDRLVQAGIGKEDAERYVASQTSLAALTVYDMLDSGALNYMADDRYNAIKKNSDYKQGTIDFINDCVKRRPFTNILAEVQRANPDRVFNATDLEAIRIILEEEGYPVGCVMCFVDDRRQNMGNRAQEFIDILNGNIPEDVKMNDKRTKIFNSLKKAGVTYVPQVVDLVNYEEFKKLHDSDDPQKRAIYDAYNQYNNSFGMASVRLVEGDAQYKREILDWDAKKVDKVNSLGGLRIFSFSDFEAHHLLDIVQIVQDCAAKGVKIQGYTKVPAFAKAMAATGMKINRSHIAKGLGYHVDENGNYYINHDIQRDENGKAINYKDSDIDVREGIDPSDPDFIDANGNVGNNIIGISWEHVKAAMADPYFHQIIPFHTGLDEARLVQKGIKHWFNFKRFQTEKDASTFSKKENGLYNFKKSKYQCNFYTDVIQPMLKRGETITAQSFGERFIEVCEKHGAIPRFWQVLDEYVGEDGQLHYKYVPGYEKLLVDYPMFDADGNYVPQEAVVPEFDDEFNTSVLAKYVETEQQKSTPEAIEKKNRAVSRIINEVVNGDSSQISKASDIDFNGEEFPMFSLAANSVWDNNGQQYGTYDNRSTRKRDANTPKQVNDDRITSKFFDNVMQNADITPEQFEDAKEAFANNGEQFSYEQVHLNDYIATAQQELAGEGYDFAVPHMLSDLDQGKVTPKLIVKGEQLLADAFAKGDTENALKLTAKLCVVSHEAGVALNAFKALRMMGGIGNATYVSMLVDRLNNKTYADRIKKGKMKPLHLDTGLVQDLANAKTDTEINNALEAIFYDVGRQIPPTLKDAINAWRYTAMLGNPVTHARNLTGNVMMGALATLKDWAATGIERGFVKDRSQWTHAMYNPFSAENRTIADKAKESWESHKSYVQGSGKLSFEARIKNYARTSNIEAVNAVEKFVSNCLEGEDAWSLKRAYVDAYTQYCIAQGLDPNKLTKAQEEEIAEHATLEAQKRTFRDPSWIAAWISQAARTAEEKSWLANILIEGVMPFKKTPISILRRGIEYSPIGLVKGAFDSLINVKNGKVSVKTAVDEIASGATGTVLLGLGMLLARLGALRSHGEDEDEYEQFLEQTGDQQYAMTFHLGGQEFNIALSQLAPAAIPLFMGASLAEGLDSNTGMSLLTTLANAANPMMEMSFLSSLNQALSSYSSYNKNGETGLGAIGAVATSIGKSYASQFIPSLGGKIANIADDTKRTQKGFKNSAVGDATWDSYIRGLERKVPGLENTLEESVDSLGRTKKKTGFTDWLLSVANNLVLPANVNVVNRDAVDNEIIDVFEMTGEAGVLPTAPSKYLTQGSGNAQQRYDFTAEEYTQYSKQYGQAVYSAIKAVMSDPKYVNAESWDARAEMLKKAVENAEKTIRDIWKEEKFNGTTSAPGTMVFGANGSVSFAP